MLIVRTALLAGKVAFRIQPERMALYSRETAMKECNACGKCFEDEQAECGEDRVALRPAFPGPALIDGKYFLIRKLGRGSMGTVYRARHVGLLKDFAVKLIHPWNLQDETFRARFRVEAQALGRLSHPGIVQVTDFGIDSRNLPYLVMEFLEGESLAQILAERKLNHQEILSVLRSVGESIDHAHENGVLHRDLKTSNIFLLNKTSPARAKLLDFGIASISSVPDAGPSRGPILPAELTGTGELLGTADYAAPEVCSGKKAEPASDLYSFGIIAYEMFTGKRPFQGSFQSVVEAHRSSPPLAPSSINPSVPRELDAPILSLLQKAAARRPSRASAAVDAMEHALREGLPRNGLSIAKWRRSALALLLLVAACAALLLPPRNHVASPVPATVQRSTPVAENAGRSQSDPPVEIRISSKEPFAPPAIPRRIGVALRGESSEFDVESTVRFIEMLSAQKVSLKPFPLKLSFASGADFSKAFNGLPFDIRSYHPEDFEALLLGYESLRVLPRKIENPIFEVQETLDLRVFSPQGVSLHSPARETASGSGLNVSLAQRRAMQAIAAKVAAYL